MFFINKIKPVKLEIHTWVGKLIDLFPPKLAKESKPDWWYNMEVQKGPHRQASVKHCYGMKDLYDEGIMVPAWGDYDITVSPTGPINVQSPVQQTEGHSSVHLLDNGRSPWAEYVNAKLHSPWAMYCDEPIKWALLQPAWAQTDPQSMITVPGMTEFRYQHQAHANMIFKRGKQPYTVKIKAGDPLIHIVPITERPLEIEYKVLSQQEWGKKFARWTFTTDYLYHKTRALFERKK